MQISPIKAKVFLAVSYIKKQTKRNFTEAPYPLVGTCLFCLVLSLSL